MRPSGVVTSYVYALAMLFAQVNPIDGQEAASSRSSPSEGQRQTTPEGLGDDETPNQCRVVSRPKSSREEYLGQIVERRFFFRPGPGFKRMIFRMRLENTLTSSRSFQVSSGLAFKSSEIMNSKNTSTEAGVPEDDWFLVEVEDFKFVRKWGRDRNALRVSINGLTKELITKNWWSVNRYRGFDLYAKGKSYWAFDCDPRSHCPERVQLAFTGPLPEVSHVRCWAIIGVLLFVIMVVVSLLVFFARRSSALKSSPKQWSLGKEFMEDKLSSKSADEQQSKSKNLYVTGPIRPSQGTPTPIDDEHLYAEISEASFVAWSSEISEKNLESVSLESTVAAK